MTVASVQEAGGEPDAIAKALIARLAASLMHLREEGLFNLEQFVIAAEREMGGTLVIQCPSRFKKRAVPEVRFASEGFLGTLNA